MRIRTIAVWEGIVIGMGLVLLVLLVSGGRVSAAEEDDKALREQALALNKVTGDGPIQGKMKALLADEKNTRALLKVALKMAKEDPQPFNLNATYILAAVAQELKEVDTSETFYLLNTKQALKILSGRAVARAYVGRIQLLYDAGRYAESEQACREFLGIEGDDAINDLKAPVLRQLILNLYRQKQVDKAMGLLDRIIHAQPNNFFNVELKARLLRAEGKTKESIEVYQGLVESVGKDERLTKEERGELIDDYRYALSGLYVDIKEIDKAAGELQELLKKHPDNSTYNNDLGYIWADHDKNLEEAERLIRKAIDLDRKQQRKRNPELKPGEEEDTAAYLDSLGWVLFKQGKHKEALPWLEKAVQDPLGMHIEIYDHLGDVYQALGQKDKAREAYKKGIAVVGENKREQQRKVVVEKKLEALSK
jgi:tetratricopeptide (TPR) repeat protein